MRITMTTMWRTFLPLSAPNSSIATAASRGPLFLVAKPCHLGRPPTSKPDFNLNGGRGPFSNASPPWTSLSLSTTFSRAYCSCMGVFSGGYAIPSLLRDSGAAALVMGGAYSLVLAFDVLTKKNLIDQKLSRKLVHVLSGILYMTSWPLFSASMEARFFAAIVPLVNCLRLLIYGLSLAKDEGLVKSVTREGNPMELLRGPLYYVIVLLICVLYFWRDSPVGLISLSMMSGGDGLADIMGRNFGSRKLPHNHQKSWVGSVSMLVFGFLVSIGILHYYSSLGFLVLDSRQVVEKVLLVSLSATVVESLPLTDVLDDNISVPLSSILVAILLFD